MKGKRRRKINGGKRIVKEKKWKEKMEEKK